MTYRPSLPDRVAHPLIAQVFAAMDAQGVTPYAVAPRIGCTREMLWKWRRQAAMPSLALFYDAAQVAGLRLVLVPDAPALDGDAPPAGLSC